MAAMTFNPPVETLSTKRKVCPTFYYFLKDEIKTKLRYLLVTNSNLPNCFVVFFFFSCVGVGGRMDL